MRTSILALTLAAVAAGTASAEQYPLRAKYPQTTPIATEQFARQIGKAVVVDVRSHFEFTVMHVAGAVHIDFGDARFLEQLTEAVAGDRSRGVITYCNGTTCDKSYDAAVAAQQAGFTNVRVYDAGIFEWVRMARGRTLLFGKPVQPEDIITEARFEAHLAEAAAFEKGAGGADVLLIDVRDAQQREQTARFAQKAEWISVDRLVQRLATKAFQARAEGKTLYIFDNVGKQVRWLQYALEANGYSRYVFLENGMVGLFAGPTCGGSCG